MIQALPAPFTQLKRKTLLWKGHNWIKLVETQWSASVCVRACVYICVDLSAGLLWGLGTDRVERGQVEAVHSELVEVMQQSRGQVCALTRTLRPCQQKPWSVWGWLLIGRPDSEGKKITHTGRGSVKHTQNLLHDRSKQLFSLLAYLQTSTVVVYRRLKNAAVYYYQQVSGLQTEYHIQDISKNF